MKHLPRKLYQIIYKTLNSITADTSRIFINTSGYNSDYICACYIDVSMNFMPTLTDQLYTSGISSPQGIFGCWRTNGFYHDWLLDYGVGEKVSCYCHVELVEGEWKGENVTWKMLLINFNGYWLQEVSAKYWPDKGETLKIGPFEIETTSESKADTFFVRRIMQVTNFKVSDDSYLH